MRALVLVLAHLEGSSRTREQPELGAGLGSAPLLPKGLPAAGRAGEELPGCGHSPCLLCLGEDAPRARDVVWPGGLCTGREKNHSSLLRGSANLTVSTSSAESRKDPTGWE